MKKPAPKKAAKPPADHLPTDREFETAKDRAARRERLKDVDL